MEIKRKYKTVWFSLILLLSIAKSSHQTVYSCDAAASCGCSSQPVSTSRIVGGETAASGTWGWAVSLSISGVYLCGGSIISNSWVITAAHCVDGIASSQITIYAGSTQRWVGTQNRTVAQVIVHSDYNPTDFVNDIALLKLASPLNMSDPYVSVICLPSVDSSTLVAGEWPTVATTVVAIGWGTLNETGGSFPSNLQQVTIETVAYNADTCIINSTNWHVQLCAGVAEGGKDTCQGDSGGPLMMFITSIQQWMLVGLTSNGIGCARAEFAGVYTRVAAFQDWIILNTNNSVTGLTSTVSTSISTTIQTVSSTTVSTTVLRTVASTSLGIILSHGTASAASMFTIVLFTLTNLLMMIYFH